MKNKSILTLSNSQLEAYDHSPIRNIHTKRIDTGITSINIGHTLTGDLIKGRIDKLSFVSHSTEQRNIDSLNKALKSLNSDMLYRVKHIKSNQANYGDLILIRYKNSKGRYAKTIIRIEYSPRNQVRGAIRFELSPQHFTEQELNQVICWLADNQRIGKRLFKILRKAWVTRVDVALDVYAPLMRDCYISLEGARTGEVIDSNDDLLTIHMGSDASRYFATAYEKVEKVAKHNRESIMLTASDKLKLFTRIEIRVKPKKHEVLLANLDTIANLSKMIQIYPKAMINDPKLPKEFITALTSGTKTIPEARALFMGNEYYLRSKRRKIAKVLAKHRINLVDNYDELWAYYYLFIQAMGLLGRPLYWHREDLREQYLIGCK